MKRLLPLLLAACAAPRPETAPASAVHSHFLAIEGASATTPSTAAALEERGWAGLPPAASAARFEDAAAHGASAWLHASELRLRAGGRENWYLGARDAWRWLAATRGGEARPADVRRRAYRLYNHNLAAYASAADWSRGRDRVAGEPVALVRRGVAARRFARVVPACGVDVAGFGRHVVTSGAGGAVLAAYPRDSTRDRDWPYLYPDTYMAPLCAVLDFADGRGTVTLHDAAEGGWTELFGKRVPLKVDYTAAWVAQRAEQRSDWEEEGARGFRSPDASLQAVYMIAPPDPERRVVLFVHGLDSSPRAFRELALALLADPEIRKNYQFVAYRYASGYPLLLNNAMFRRRLRGFLDWFEEAAPAAHAKGVVAIGHSMGGLQVKPLAQASGLRVWHRVFRRPPHRVALDTPEGAFLRDALIFEPVSEIRRLVFLAVPHRGSGLASGIAGFVGKSEIAADPQLERLKADALARYRDDLRPAIRRRLAGRTTSVDSLEPGDPYVATLAELPVAVPFHSVIGDTGGRRGDGVVPFESARLAGAESELVIPWGHNVTASPACHAEVRRILLRELGE